MGLLEQLPQLRRQPPHLLLKRFAVVLLLLNAHIPPWREDIVLLCDLLQVRRRAEPLDLLQCPRHESVVGIRDLPDVLVRQLPQLPADHRPHFPGVDEQRFPLLLLVFRQEPQGHGNLRGVEQLGRHGYDAVHQISLYHIPANVSLAPGLGGQGAVCQHHADAPAWGQVPDHVLEPGKVGVPGGRHSVLPPHVLPQLVRAPVGEVERRICHNKVGLELGVAVVEEGVGAELTQVSVNAPDG